MKKSEAEQLVINTFTHAFSEGQFTTFIRNLLPGIQAPSTRTIPNAQLPQGFREHVHNYTRLGTYRDPQGVVLDVVIVKLKSQGSLDRARTRQRNLMAHYLNRRDKDAVLVAYIADDPSDWRFSFVKLAFQTKISDQGKVKVQPEYTPARRFSFLVGKHEPNHTAQKQLGDLLMNDGRPTIKRVEEAFNIETVTKEFFEDYKSLFLMIKENLDQILETKPNVKAEFHRCEINTANFAKKLLGQIVFLYFLQKKGWLGVAEDQAWGKGDKKFLSNLFEKNKDKNFFDEILEPFFYEALAMERKGDFYLPLSCKVPFLNGGLFEPLNGYDWKNTSIGLDNKDFEEIFRVFNLYNFTVREDEPLEKEVAVDPEMLGRVFESLIDENERKGLGAYYTPREVVHFMCQESLINYLDTNINHRERGLVPEKGNQSDLFGSVSLHQTVITEEIVEELIPISDLQIFIREGDISLEVDSLKVAGELKSREYGLPESIRSNASKLEKALKSIKICDPAIGSGAFPVGMMTEVVKARKVISPYLSDSEPRNDYELKWHCIENSLYGVDIDPGAVEIAKLRLWLSLIVDEQHFGRIRPLPNLDYKIVCGNSLLYYPYQRRDLDEYEYLKSKFFNETDPAEKRKQKHHIDQVLVDLFKNTKRSLGYQVSVDFKINFSEVFTENDGFDVVIGNPPYVKEYTNRHAFDGLRKSPYYQGKMDLWYFFGSVGLDILKSNGVECFIAPNNWVSNAGASKFRKKVVNEARIVKFIDFGDFKVFEAGIQTMIYIIQRSSKPSIYELDYQKLIDQNLNQDSLIQFLYATPSQEKYHAFPVHFNRAEFIHEFITFLRPEVKRVLDRINNNPIEYLSDSEAAQGIVCPQDFLNRKSAIKLNHNYKVGDGVFVLSDSEKASLDLTTKEETEILRPYFTTEELDRFYGNSNNTKWIIYTRSDINSKIDKYPNIRKHLDKFKSIITSDNKPYGLHRARDERFFIGEKIISLRKSLQPTFTYTNFDCYVSQTFFVIKTSHFDMKYLTGILNSKLIAFWLRYKGKMQGSHYQVDKAPLISIPLLSSSKRNVEVIRRLVDFIIFLKSYKGPSNKSPIRMMARYFEQIIDALVYEIYFEKEFHSENREFFSILKNEDLPNLLNTSNENFETISKIYKRLFAKDHPIRQGVFYLDSNETVRIIEGKYEN